MTTANTMVKITLEYHNGQEFEEQNTTLANATEMIYGPGQVTTADFLNVRAKVFRDGVYRVIVDGDLRGQEESGPVFLKITSV